MILLRKAKDRGQSQMEWLKSHHSFSFGDYYDPSWMGFNHIRVINEDYIQASRGFDKHPHRDMEIITYVVSGVLKHEDSMGNGSLIPSGEIQRMSAGRGVWHSEFNASSSKEVHLYQIWILPLEKGVEPGYEQKKIKKEPNKLIQLASNHPTTEAVTVHQNLELFLGFFEKNKTITRELKNKTVWLQVIKGLLICKEQKLEASDGLGIWDDEALQIQCLEDSEFLLFELGT